MPPDTDTEQPDSQSGLPPDPTIAGYAASDGPTPDDTLGFKPYVEAIASFLTAEHTQPPITISIEGEWGSGKSSFLLQLEIAILEISPKDSPKPLTVRFNAWRHDKQDQLWAAFALTFIESLRKKIGWRHAIEGDWKLFWERLDWKKLSESEPARNLCVLAFAILALTVAITAAKLSRLPLADLFHLLCWLWNAKGVGSPPANFILNLAVDGPWAIIVSASIAALWKAWKAFRFPISLDLKKYIADPAYEGHTAFVETFHKDFRRLVKSYAGNSRVFIFIDDLDRCDIPRAAELMQAINLMIGDNDQLVFILGMDREKVAAGVALKYKDLLPFLRETAKWKAGENPDDHSPIAFGYAYLEKFIQLSFTLPIPNTTAILNRFLAPKPTAARSVSDVATPADEPASTRDFTSNGTATPSLDTTEVPQTTNEPQVEYHRVKIDSDDERTRDIIRMTAPIFDYNPRRLKQFTNTFRLALYVASDLGIFDKSKSAEKPRNSASPTPEQVGKFIALVLRFPDLRFALERRTNLLALLEMNAIHVRTERLRKPDTQPAERFSRWLDEPGAIDLLTYHLGFDGFMGDQLAYSLKEFDASRLLTVLPRASRPPENLAGPAPSKSVPESAAKADAASGLAGEEGVTPADAFALARRYEEIRGSMKASNERTWKMTEIVNEAVALANLQPFEVSLWVNQLLSSGNEGDRLIALALAFSRPAPGNKVWLIHMLEDHRSWFEQYWCIRALLKHIDFLDLSEKGRIVEILNNQWEEIAKDPGRINEARELRELASQTPYWARPPQESDDPNVVEGDREMPEVPPDVPPAA